MPTSDNFRGEVGEAEIKALLLSVRNMFEIGILEEGLILKTFLMKRLMRLRLIFKFFNI